MSYPLSPHDKTERLHAHDLQLTLRSTHSILAYHTPYIKDGKSLRMLDLALLNAIADLQVLNVQTSEGDQHSLLRTPS